jgi:FkbM family methyltransferase
MVHCSGKDGKEDACLSDGGIIKTKMTLVNAFINPFDNLFMLNAFIDAFTSGYGKLRGISPKDNFYLYLSYAEGLLNYLFFRKRFITISLFLRKDIFVVDGNGIKYYVKAKSDCLALLAGTAKPWTKRWFKPKKGEMVIDAGSNIGRFSLYAASMGAYAIGVEPNPSVYEILKKNIELNGFANAKALNLGLGDTEGEMELYVPPGYTGSSSFNAQWETRFELNKIKVKVVPLDSETRELPSIDWLLIDVEGFEEKVLKGAGDVLKKTKRIIIEISHENRERVLELLGSNGFKVMDEGSIEEKAQYFYLEGTWW